MIKARSALLLVFGLGIVLLERRRPLRQRREETLTHTARNLTIAGLSAGAVHFLEAPVVMPLAKWTERRKVGLVNLLPVPQGVRDALAVVLLDYTLYWWHILTHRTPALWRLHLVHHVDRDLDASTAIRFHFAEISASVPWRAAQVAVIGASPRALTLWQTLTLASITFHHSNARLPLAFERLLSRVVVTPRMHGIHHSIVRAEADGNYSSGIALWDWLHGTIRLNVPQQQVDIGVPRFRTDDEVALRSIVSLPAIVEGGGWRFRDGREPQPATSDVPREQLLA